VNEPVIEASVTVVIQQQAYRHNRSQQRRCDTRQISQFSISRRATVQTPVITDHATYVEYQEPEIDDDQHSWENAGCRRSSCFCFEFQGRRLYVFKVFIEYPL